MSADALSAFQTAVQYQIVHSLALIAVGLWLARHPEDMLSRYAAFAFCFGILFFSGSLYGLTLGGPRWLGPVTPIGGTLFIAGWFLFAASLSSGSGIYGLPHSSGTIQMGGIAARHVRLPCDIPEDDGSMVQCLFMEISVDLDR